MSTDIPVELPSPDAIDLAVEVFKMLAEGTRLRILWCLIEGESSVGDLAAQVEKSHAAVSQHLAKLRMARLVQTRREGNTIFYRIASEHARLLAMDAVHHAEHQGSELPKHHRQGFPGEPASKAE
ncbi:Ni(II)/Co(II)-sensing metalloregulatory transcriptional repressor KmtR [soil metagenome]